MMKRFFTILLLCVVFLTSFVLSFPKERLYYYAQEKLLSYNVVVESQTLRSDFCGVYGKRDTLLLSGSRIATIKEFSLTLSGMHFSDIKALGSFKSSVPVLKSIDISYNPKRFLVARGDFGEIVGSLEGKKILLEAKITQGVRNRYSMLFSNFKKIGGKYVYKIDL